MRLVVEHAGRFDDEYGNVDAQIRAENSRWIKGKRFISVDGYTNEEENPNVGLIICHLSINESNLKLLLTKRPKAKILTVSNGGPSLQAVQMNKPLIPEQDRQRVFGSAQSGSIDIAYALWDDLINYFANGEVTPAIEMFLGMDLPIRRLALQVALEIVRHELVSRQNSNRKGLIDPPDDAIRKLLEPPFDVSHNTPALKEVMEPVKLVLDSNDSMDALLLAIEKSCSTLREAARAAVREQ
jgi:hypothetical protein